MTNIGMLYVIGLLTAHGAVYAQEPTYATAKAAGATAISKDVDQQIRRGERLARFGGCHDCHTPKIMTPHGPELDRTRLLSGYPSQASLPAVPQGVIAPTQWGALATNDLMAWAGP
ncbi:MAG: hypothetical protein JO166_16625, partial [Deltaproteobacteria bacterium]|nr:hypothetical protein [Deltaproteobacteria bacterium]